MRTRFLFLDYFNLTSETLDFLRLSPPCHLPPPTPYPSLSSLIGVSIFRISLDLEPLPIDNALSSFLSNVIPDFIDIEAPHESSQYEEKSEHSFDAKEDTCIEVVEFEVPQLDISLENDHLFEKKLELFSGILEADNNLSTTEPGLTLHYPSEALEKVYEIDDIIHGGHMEQKPLLLENASPVKDQVQINDCIFPLFEVDEISLGIFNGIGIEEEGLLFNKIETLECQNGGEGADYGNELLNSLEIDILEHISDPTLSNHSSINVMVYSSSYTEMDLISIIELSYPADDNSISVGILKFEEYQFLDLSSYQPEDVLYKMGSVSGLKTCENMHLEDLVVEDFNELIVSRELTPIDESFKSLPIPILSDYGNISSHNELVVEILASVDPQPSSISNDIYLDWQFLKGDYRNHEKCSSCWKQVLEIDKYSIDQKSFIDGRVIFEFAFSSDTPKVVTVEDDKETLAVHSVGTSAAGVSLNNFSTTRLNLDKCQKSEDHEVSLEKVSSVIRSMSPFDNLNFFLNPREATNGKSFKPSVKAIPSLDQNAPCVSTTVQPQPWDLEFHQVHLSGYFSELIAKFQQNYLAILKGDSVLANIKQSSLALDDIALLSLPKNTLLNWIKNQNDRKNYVADSENTARALVTLCAIKQMAWYLCYFGVHPTYIYLKQLSQNLDCLGNKLSFLRNLIEDAHTKTKGDITVSHPSLSVIQSVLQTQMNNGGMKLLIVADPVFWLPLKILLTSLHISYCDEKSLCIHKRQDDLCGKFEFPEAVQRSDCLLIFTETISASFPFDKFSIIMEYGGPCSSSRVSTILPKPFGFPGLHFFKLETEEYSVTKALCEGVVMACTSSSPTELEKLLDFIPTEEHYHMGSSEHDNIAFTNMPNIQSMEEQAQSTGRISSESSFPEILIIVNTQNLNKEMIISRRSTYQKILAMEKKGAQVVERDLKFPVDVIISAAMCLVWYDCGNIRNKATAPNEACSSLPMCIENIAANILTSLSFSFNCCILIFEGESNFLSAIMESSDGLYAAAFTLKMDLQLFLSHSSELTDEIILSCIESSTKITKQIYPRMPESETIGESFLTSFRSLNPLSAHAILSSGGTLFEFLEWSNERRLLSVQKYNVPNESFRLFNTLCKYGEREDSRSAMTDCSSSVSSAPESRSLHCRTVSSAPESRSLHCKTETVKNVQRTQSPDKIGIPMDDLFNLELLKQFENDNWNQPNVSKPHGSWAPGDGKNYHKIQEDHLFNSEFPFIKKQGIAAHVEPMMTPAKRSNHLDCQMPRGSFTSYETKKRSWPFDCDNFGPEKSGHVSSLDRFNFDLRKKSRNPQEDLKGEVIDITDSYPVIDDFSSMRKSMDPSAFVLETDEYISTGNPRTARRLSFSGPHVPTFPTSSEISSDFNLWDNIDDKGQSSNKLPLKHQSEFLEGCLDEREATNFPFHSVRERQTQQPSVSALANAVLTAQPQQGSPWTIEFLNRIREKSRLRHQALPPNMSPMCSPFLKNKSKGTKRKSPSILDFYRYQGGSTKTPNKTGERKMQRRPSQPPGSAKKEKTSCVPAWTPVDKRARQTLSFSTGGGGGQSKLIWSQKDANNMNRRFYQ